MPRSQPSTSAWPRASSGSCAASREARSTRTRNRDRSRMHLYELPLIFVLAGLVLYTVLGGADFGAGIWQLLARGSERVRDLAHNAMAPVWEANHVWIIFVLTVTWTAYPQAFASIASTLSVPLFIAALGIIMRGAAYALRSGARTAGELR